MADNELFKLVTRRYLAWGFAAIGGAVLAFTAVWGAIQGMTELVTLAGGGLLTLMGTLIGFYFGKKTSEE